MTDKTAPTTEEHREQLGTLEHVDPHLLVLDENVRDVARLVPEFAASVREHGVLQPITAVQGADGVVRVRNGSLSSSVLLSVRVARQSAVVAVTGQGEITRDTGGYRKDQCGC
jgi:hypothetical protein